MRANSWLNASVPDGLWINNFANVKFRIVETRKESANIQVAFTNTLSNCSFV